MLWDTLVRKMIEDGVEIFVEVGPGRVLGGLLRRIDRGVKGLNVAEPKDVDKVVAALPPRGGDR